MYQPFKVGRRWRIVPPGTPAMEGRTDLIIAKGAFGSGEHETTASCLQIMEEMPEIHGAKTLDLGSGTGILALAALHLGAAEAVCVDISPDAVRTCRRNCELNGVTDRARHVTGSIDTLGPETFDLVLANIYGDLLLDLADSLSARSAAGGLMLLSGMLWEFNFEVRRQYERRGFELVQNRMLDEFSTILMKNRHGC